MYMDVRLALPINSNPGMVFPPRKFTTVHDVARFSARIIDGIIVHKETLERYAHSSRPVIDEKPKKNHFQRTIGAGKSSVAGEEPAAVHGPVPPPARLLPPTR